MTFINRQTYIAEAQDEDGTGTKGTVEVTIRGQTRRVRASESTKYGWLFAYGISGRYQTGGKVWPGSICQNKDGSEYVNFGRDDRHPKFRKENAIFFS